MSAGASVKPQTLAPGCPQRVRRQGEGASGRPIVIDLFCGLGGWSEGFLAEGWDVIGFDVERHRYPSREFAVDTDSQKSMHGKDRHGNTLMNRALEQVHGFHRAPLTGGWDEYPGQLVLQDVLTLHGRQFQDAACIVASPPCQEFSYMAMPWRRAKQIAMTLREEPDANGNFADFPPGYTGSRTLPQLTALFDACFRIQREASEAAGHHIPMVVENVKGAQPWVGRANANYGSFYLWGDVRSVGGRIVAAHRVEFGAPAVKAGRAQKSNPDGTQHGTGSWFAVADSKNRGASKLGALTETFNGHDGPNRGRETTNGSWLAMGANGKSNLKDGVKAPGNDTYRLTGLPCGKLTDPRYPSGGVATFERRDDEGTKQGGNWWHDPQSITRRHSSKSSARKAASAQIAKIPLALSEYIARSFRPKENE